MHFFLIQLILGTIVLLGEIECNSISNSTTEYVPLSKTNTPIVQSNVTIAGESAKQLPFIINPDAEQIFLPLTPQHYHPDKVLERFTASAQQEELNPFLQDLRPYILKPFIFDYTKALAEARETAKKQIFVTQPSLIGRVVPQQQPEHGSPINGILSISSHQQQDGGFGVQSQINKPQFAALQYQPQTHYPPYQNYDINQYQVQRIPSSSWTAYNVPSSQNSFVGDRPRAEPLIRAVPQKIVQFSRPHLNATPIGQSFYDNRRLRQNESPNRPLIHKFATSYQSPNENQPETATILVPTTSEPTTTPTTDSYETTTRQTIVPDSYKDEPTTTPYHNDDDDDDDDDNTQEDSDDDSPTTERNRFGKYSFEKNPFYEKYSSSEQSGEEEFDGGKSYFKEFNLDGSPFHRLSESAEDDEHHGESRNSEKKSKSFYDSVERPHSSRLVATTTSTTTTRRPLHLKYSNSNRRQSLKTTKSPEYEDQDQDYTFHEIKTFSDTFGSKPGKSYNKFSQVKVIRKDKSVPTTTTTSARPATYKKKSSKPPSTTTTTARPTKKKSSKKLEKLKTVKEVNARGKIKFLYDSETYHPEESRVVSTVYSRDGRIIRQDLDPAPSHYRQQQYGSAEPTYRAQLNAITTRTPQPQLYYGSHPFESGARSSDVEKVRPTTVRTISKQPQPTEMRYFQYVNVFPAKGGYNAGVGKGHEDHYVESHELADNKNGTFRRRVRWGDKTGGFGEHYYDLNHHQPSKSLHR